MLDSDNSDKHNLKLENSQHGSSQLMRGWLRAITAVQLPRGVAATRQIEGQVSPIRVIASHPSLDTAHRTISDTIKLNEAAASLDFLTLAATVFHEPILGDAIELTLTAHLSDGERI